MAYDEDQPRDEQGRWTGEGGGDAKAVSEDEYLAQHGASADWGDPGLHRSDARVSGAARERQSKELAARHQDLQNKRDKLREEYRQKVESGELRAPSHEEELKRIASGSADNESTKAAQRLLEKKSARSMPEKMVADLKDASKQRSDLMEKKAILQRMWEEKLAKQKPQSWMEQKLSGYYTRK